MELTGVTNRPLINIPRDHTEARTMAAIFANNVGTRRISGPARERTCGSGYWHNSHYLSCIFNLDLIPLFYEIRLSNNFAIPTITNIAFVLHLFI